MPLSKNDFKISTNINLSVLTIEIKDTSPWIDSTDRYSNGLALFWTKDNGVSYGMDLLSPFADMWVIPLDGPGVYNIILFGVEKWDESYAYLQGNVVLSAVGDSTRDPEAQNVWKFWHALTASTDAIPFDNQTEWESFTGKTGLEAYNIFNALTDAAGYTVYRAESVEIHQDEEVCYEKLSCFEYKIKKTSSEIVSIDIYTLEAYENGTDPINSESIIFEPNNELTFKLTSYTNSDGDPYKDGVYVINFNTQTGTGKNVHDYPIVEICNSQECVENVIKEVLCLDCGCNNPPCTPEETALDRNRRDFLNTIIGSFGMLMSRLMAFSAEQLYLQFYESSQQDLLREVSFLVDKINNIINTCNLCDDD